MYTHMHTQTHDEVKKQGIQCKSITQAHVQDISIHTCIHTHTYNIYIYIQTA